MPKIVTLKIDKLVFGGQGLGKIDDKVFFVWNALPGEEVEAEVIKDKKTYAEAVARKILKSSPERIEPTDAHFLVCGPWQMMSFETENRWKAEMARETYEKIGKFDSGELEIEFDEENQFNYRNKIEYSFTEVEGKIKLAFFERGKKYRSAIEPCELASNAINETAEVILNWINENKIPNRSLKALIIRSNEKNQTIAALFIKDKIEYQKDNTVILRLSKDGQYLDLKNFPKLTKNLIGFQLYYSTHKSPASVVTADLFSAGQSYIVEELNGVKLKYGLISFFQINVKMFSRALKDIEKFLDKKSDVVDYYSGVGAIGLALNKSFKSAVLVENNEEAVVWAKDNIVNNEIENCRAELSTAEKMLDEIKADKIIILDPPRAGLHPDVVKRLLDVKPKKIIYLSCNLSTQARDLELLTSAYKIKFVKLYNFFPRTPHVEGLCVMEKR
jgi:23S rRNA (uracil1939-C5)-methyltransferase